MNMKFFITTLALCGALSGCETTPISSELAKPVPPDRVITQMPESATNMVKLVVTRDEGLLGAGLRTRLLFDGKSVAILGVGETHTFYTPAGEHIAAIVPEPSFGASLREYEVTARAGKVGRYRITMGSDGPRFQPTLTP